jgi:outer membrane receptor for ferrienterochelin and colicins
MKNIRTIMLVLIQTLATGAYAQQFGTLKGNFKTDDGPLEQGAVFLMNTNFGTYTDFNGDFSILNIPVGNYRLRVSAVGFASEVFNIEIREGQTTNISEKIKEDRLGLNEIVVSSSRYEHDKDDAPSIVSVVGPRLFNATQSMSMSEGLGFQPGIRIEANCQNCGFTQVRMNGLEGPYSQILMNSRPIFSTLTGVYGLEMIPANMIERVEIVRSGGSALYGSNAIAGTINIITKDPVENSWQIGSNFGMLRGSVPDLTTNFNGSIVSEDLKSGVTFYGMRRNRDGFDADGDGFTEIVQLENNTMGAKAFFKPTDLSKLTLDINAISEFRRGGNNLTLAPHFADIAEQLDHNIFNVGLTYDQYSRDKTTKLSTYGSLLSGKRRSYYGGLGGGRTLEDSLAAQAAYGLTNDFASVLGVQITKNIGSKDILVGGIEHQGNVVKDEIVGYEKIIDQKLNSVGIYGQYEWRPTDKFAAFIGGRYDIVGVDGIYQIGELERSVDFNNGIFSPRMTLMYTLAPGVQLRGGYARGFRAPQAFDEDLHISSVDGEQKFVILSDDLKTEISDAYTLSLNYGKNIGSTQMNFLIEGFYTQLSNQFQRVNLGQQANGSFLEEVRNGSGATVSGANIEYKISPSRKFSFQIGGTIQQALYSEDEVLFEPEDEESEFPEITVSEFIRTPRTYGFMNTNWTPVKNLSIDLTGIYTGSMVVPLVVNDEEFIELINSQSFLKSTSGSATK